MRPAVLVLLAALALVSGCGDGLHLSFLDPQGPVAAQQRTHFFIILGLMMVVVVPVWLLAPWLAWRYRYGKHRDYEPNWSFAWGWEILLWGAPALITAVLAVLLWQNTLRLDPYRPLPMAGEPVEVQAIGFDWKWVFIYPDLGIASVDELAFPTDRPLALEITSATVMQAFFIPALGSQIYAMNGMTTHLHLAADTPGRFRGRNTQYNGRQFDEQRFEAVAMTESDFAAWIEAAQRSDLELDEATWSRLAIPGTATEAARRLGGAPLPLVFGDVTPGLFDRVAQPAHGGASR